MPSILETGRSRDFISGKEETRAGIIEKAVIRKLNGLTQGRLILQTPSQLYELGAPAQDGLSARLVIHDHSFWRHLAFGGVLGAVESYLEGGWETEDLVSLFRLFARNDQKLMKLDQGWAWLGQSLGRAYHFLRPNTRRGSRRNIEAHYDLGNEFFQKMLDPTMSYSSAVFTPGDDLERASVRKVDHILDLLGLMPADHLLEIGTGWGFLSRRAVSQFGCRVTTTTLSKEQAAFARQRMTEEGLADRINLLSADYRELKGQYDHLASVEMIEAVGHEHYGDFFQKCGELLKPGGRLAMQAITTEDACYEGRRREVDFIKRYIFPGSNIPCVSILVSKAAKRGGLRLTAIQEYTKDYARTLSTWRDNLLPYREWVFERYGERFWKLWMFYLAYCEAGFLDGHIHLVQMAFQKPMEA